MGHGWNLDISYTWLCSTSSRFKWWGEGILWNHFSLCPLAEAWAHSSIRQVVAILCCKLSLSEGEIPLPSTGPSQSTLRSSGAKERPPPRGKAFSQHRKHAHSDSTGASYPGPAISLTIKWANRYLLSCCVVEIGCTLKVLSGYT